MDGWTPTEESLQSLSEGCEIQSKSEMRPCGCGIKLDLQDVVYPALREIREEKSLTGFGSRVDAHVSTGSFLGFQRFLVKHADLAKKKTEIAQAMAAFGGHSVIELFTTATDYFQNRRELQKEFRRLLREKRDLLEMASVDFGKGHSIRAGGDALVFDVLKYDRTGSGYTVANNDTIVTADSMLKHHSPISVFTSLNNALNDLFLMGVNQDLVLHPVYDGTPAEVQAIQEGLRAYAKFYADRGASITIQDQGPLGLGIDVIGATVVGRAHHEIPGLSGLAPGHEILATRYLGDLSFLSMHRSLHFPYVAHDDLDMIRWKVLQKFMTPNYLIANVIRKYLPALGEQFDPHRHISYSSDISGPGLYVLEEAANASGVNVYIDAFRFIDERSLKYYRRNQTSSTNGPILLAAAPALLKKVEADLRALGLHEVWRVGKVLEKSETPTMFVNSVFETKYRSATPRTDFFDPEVHFGSGDDVEAERMSIFDRYAFKKIG